MRWSEIKPSDITVSKGSRSGNIKGRERAVHYWNAGNNNTANGRLAILSIPASTQKRATFTLQILCYFHCIKIV